MVQCESLKRPPEGDGLLVNPIPLPLEDMVPHPEDFLHHSRIHGQAHVARVVIHTLLLVKMLGMEDRSASSWAAAYIHDIGRRHDGGCRRHGRDALQRLDELPHVKALLERGGAAASDWEGIAVAVENHCREEIPKTHPHWEITAVLKDADGLDRVRLRDLDPRFLRFPQSRALLPFAKALYNETHGKITPGPGLFAELWPIAQELIRKYDVRKFQGAAGSQVRTD